MAAMTGEEIYEAATRGFVVRVKPEFLPDRSDPEQSRWAWAYTIEVENHGAETAQLLSRHWIITDARNHVEEVRGPGVVGEQPILKPGEAFRYTSGCPLETSSGAMRGSYQMVSSAGETFEIDIPEFSLHLPQAKQRLN
ncbi:MAG TPA: Co2+/Mg2+ efflux protein ApaG [Caulobacteraceae bacterium]|nr:Co2+/Mg2+ efflux protein ApaG [Caulobacteraceae bacterium]